MNLRSEEAFVREYQKYPILSRKEELMLARKYYDEGDVEARHRLFNCNLRLVIVLARKYAGQNGSVGMSFMDVVQEGSLGLWKATEKYDPDRGYRFSTYAVWWIRQGIDRELDRKKGLIRTPFNTLRSQQVLSRESEKFRLQFGREPNAEELSNGLVINRKVISAKTVERLMKNKIGRIISLNKRMGMIFGDDEHESKTTFGDLLKDESDTPDRAVEMAQLQDDVYSCFIRFSSGLRKMDEYVLHQRFLSDDPPTLETLAGHFDMSRERIRQIQRDRLAEFKDYLKEKIPGIFGVETKNSAERNVLTFGDRYDLDYYRKHPDERRVSNF